jgi:hypothetical protein
MIAEDGHDALDGLEHARDAAKGERRRTVADDFLIFRSAPAADDLDGIGRRLRIVEALVEAIECGLENYFPNLATSDPETYLRSFARSAAALNSNAAEMGTPTPNV